MRRPRPQTHKPFTITAPVGGLNTVDPAAALPPGDAQALVNMINGENGLRPRMGFAEWCTGVDGAAAEVRSILTYKGSVAGYDRTYAVTPNGIWNTTASSAAPIKVLSLNTVGGNAGYGCGLAYVTGGGVRTLLYCDEVNGYHVRLETDTDAQYGAGTGFNRIAQGAGVGQISGVNPNLFAWVISFKSRLWFVEAGSTRAWYLATGAIYGAATQFDFGQQFKRGGTLACLAVWTMDGGTGMDDLLVAISTEGEVVIYQGTDPSQIGTFSKVGGWDLGGVPAGRRLATTFGGDLLILSSTGIVPVSKLPAGRSLLSPDLFLTRKVRNLFNGLMAARKGLLGWSIIPNPADNTLIVAYPPLAGESRQQFASSLVNGAWSQYTGLPIVSAEILNGTLYFGTADGRLCVMQGYIDNVARTGSTANALAVTFSGLTAFEGGGIPNQKQVGLIRANLVAQGAFPSLAVEVRYDFDTSPIQSALPKPALPANAWDDGSGTGAKWDQALFAADSGGAPLSQTFGAAGMGVFIGVAWKGSTISRCNLVNFDIVVEAGGFL